MKADASKRQLDELKAAVKRLESYSLPVQTRSALQDVHIALTELDQHLANSQEERRLAALYRVSQSLSETLALDQVLTQVMDAVISLTGAERGFLVLLDGGEDSWHIRAARNFTQESLSANEQEFSRTIVGNVLETRTGLLTTDAQTDPRFSQQASVIYLALRSVMAAPLLARGRAIGAVYVDNRAYSGIFDEDSLRLLEAFAAQAAVAIENAWLYTRTDQALSQRVAELETLAQIDQELNASLDLMQVLEITRRWAVTGSGASQGWVLLAPPDEDSAGLVYPADSSNDSGLSHAIPSSLLQSEPRQVTQPLEGPIPRLGVPLLHAERATGAIVVESNQAFNPWAASFLERLAARAAAAIENARLYQAVQTANQEKSKFVSVVTHELRIPMTSIKGYADLLRSGVVGPLNEDQVSFINIIRNNVERMNALVSDLSDISRIETGRLKLNSQSVSLVEYLEETLLNLRAKIEEKQQSLDVEVADGTPKVYADANRVVQILTNLVTNAWKYTPEGGKIQIHVYPQDEMVRVDVRDTGIGISEQDQAQLFTQFFRSEDPDVREQQGWGLGLNVTRRLVELMRGEIGVQSKLGEGSTFWFQLPINELEVPSQEGQPAK